MGLVNDFKRWVSGEVDDDDDFDMDEGPVEESEAREASSHYSGNRREQLLHLMHGRTRRLSRAEIIRWSTSTRQPSSRLFW